VKGRGDALQHLEVTLGQLLHAGVLASAVCLAAGLILWLVRGPSTLSSGALTLGLLILMATPVMRVLVSLVAYARMRDWFFVATTVAVFVLLAVTVIVAWMKAAANS
jgi:uncharacterized membrane protein